MNKAKTIINIVEGFKLGKLGAGKVNFLRGEQEDSGTISCGTDAFVGNKWMVIGSEIVNLKGKDVSFVFGGKWKETNGYGFALVCFDTNSPSGFVIQVVGGLDYKPPTKITSLNFSKAHDFKLFQWIGSLDTEDAKDLAKTHCNDAMIAGSFGCALVTGMLKGDWSVVQTRGSWIEYLQTTAGVTKSKYFEMG
jgi:hypothetical protein